jgi:hypothetical protein
MAQKINPEYSAPSADYVITSPHFNLGNVTFELKPTLINMMQANLFCGRPHGDTNAHLQRLVCRTFTIKNVSAEAICLRLFPFLLLGKVKQLFYTNREKVIIKKKIIPS